MDTLTQTKRPKWLNKKIDLKDLSKVSAILSNLNLNTVCKEAACPNIAECFSRGEATFLILGKSCTRNCRFCNVLETMPSAIDTGEPERIAEAVLQLGLKHVVITSVTRDDLSDGGSEIFARTIRAIKDKARGVSVEVLIPDFKGKKESLKKVVEAGPDIIAHNLETVPRLYKDVRQESDYGLSLYVLSLTRQLIKDRPIYTKSGMMVGMGEREEEVMQSFYDMRSVGCGFLSIGQYLSPSEAHFPVKEYISPDRFIFYKEEAIRIGFKHVMSDPYVRSSYLARDYLGREN